MGENEYHLRVSGSTNGKAAALFPGAETVQRPSTSRLSARLAAAGFEVDVEEDGFLEAAEKFTSSWRGCDHTGQDAQLVPPLNMSTALAVASSSSASCPAERFAWVPPPLSPGPGE